MKFLFARKATQYIFFEMVPTFILGVMVFVSILLMFQALRLTEFVLIHGVGFDVVFEIITYLTVSFLPALFPMSLLFAIILTYGRMSQDSEIVAFKASGLSMISILTPALLLSFVVAYFSAQTSFHLAPWGNRQFEVLITELSQTKAGATLREGTFSEGFFEMVIYANNVDSENGRLEKVFIYDERDGETPLTIIAKRGELIPDDRIPGHSALLRLFEGDIHRKSEAHTKVNFNSFDIKLSDPIKKEQKAKSGPSLSLSEINEKLKAGVTNKEELWTLQTELHKRWAIGVACIVFALVGVGLGTTTNRRNQKSGGMILCLGVVILYWVLYVTAEGMARSGQAPAALAIWTPNLIFTLIGVWALRKNWD